MTIADFSFSPSQISARAGQPVRLSVANGGQSDHTFTIDGVVNSAIASGGRSSVEFTPAQAGALTFYCAIHGRATMSGTVTVQ